MVVSPDDVRLPNNFNVEESILLACSQKERDVFNITNDQVELLHFLGMFLSTFHSSYSLGELTGEDQNIDRCKYYFKALHESGNPIVVLNICGIYLDSLFTFSAQISTFY